MGLLGDIILLRRAIFGLLALFMLAACDQRAIIAENTPPDVLKQAHWFFDMLRKGDIAALERVTVNAPGMTDPQRRAALEQMASDFPKTEPESSEVLGLHVNFPLGGKAKRTQLVIEYRIGKPSVLATVNIERWSEHDLRVVSAHYEVLPASFAEMNAFTLTGKDLVDYLILAGAILVPLFSAGTAVFIWLRPNLRRKWLWVPLSLLVILKVDLNWTTGVTEYQPFYLGIFPITVDLQSHYGPWLFQLSLPIGALIFWVIRPGRRPQKPLTDVTVFD